MQTTLTETGRLARTISQSAIPSADYLAANAGLWRSRSTPLITDAPAISHPYYFLRVLGEGTFGRVYHAVEQSLDRPVAVKVFREADSPDQTNWFREEGRVVASLAHPGIVSVYISGLTDDGRWYITYQYIEGSDLAAIVRQARLPAGEVGELLARVAAALHHAHEKGLVHRDVKPSNVLIDAAGTPYVTDFGLAIRATRSVPGQVAGTPAYMSPEQWRCEAVTRATDVWAVGVMLHELLVGSRPFAGSTLEEMRTAVLRAATEPASLADEVPLAFRGVVQRCLAARPGDRFANCADLADALRQANAAFARGRLRRVLWVNDKAGQGEEEIRHLRSLGVEIVRAASTTEAMRQLISGSFIPDVIVSDMGRLEEGEYRPHAGLLLTELVRKARYTMPVVIYGSPQYQAKNQTMSLACGGDGAVANRQGLYRFLGVVDDQ